MKERTLKELYQIVLDNFDKNQDFLQRSGCYGICHHFNQIDISWEERDLIIQHFEDNKPKIISKFWWNWNYNHFYNAWWWTKDEKGNKQRKLFLQHIINSL